MYGNPGPLIVEIRLPISAAYVLISTATTPGSYVLEDDLTPLDTIIKLQRENPGKFSRSDRR